METVSQYIVYADRNTGEWINEPEYVRDVELNSWHKMVDTNKHHYDTNEVGSETKAIMVVWVAQ